MDSAVIKALPNGVKIVVDRINHIRSVAFGIFVKCGSRNETTEQNGMSHFIEHMLFKGTKERSAKEIAEELDAVGGQLNAYTTKEYTCYYTKTLDIHFDIALSVLSDMFFNSVFDETEIKKEANVISEEISMYEDSPEDLVHDILQMNVWHGDALGMPILGTEDTVFAFDFASVTAFLKQHYTAENTVISLAGNVNEHMIEAVSHIFSSLPSKETKNIINTPVFSPVFTEIEKDIEQLHMLLSFESFGIETDARFPMAVFNTFFGGGMSSRLFQNIREDKGLVYSIYSYNSSFANAGIFGIYAALNPENAPAVLRCIKKEIDALKREIAPEIVIKKAKEQIINNHFLGLESSSNRMSTAGRGILLLNKVLTTEGLMEKLDDVSEKTICEMTDNMFFSKKPAICAVGKLSDKLRNTFEDLWG